MKQRLKNRLHVGPADIRSKARNGAGDDLAGYRIVSTVKPIAIPSSSRSFGFIADHTGKTVFVQAFNRRDRDLVALAFAAGVQAGRYAEQDDG